MNTGKISWSNQSIHFDGSLDEIHWWNLGNIEIQFEYFVYELDLSETKIESKWEN